MNKHSFWMIIGCTVPLLLIFLLPLFGVTGNYTFLIFIVLMFGCHLMMMGMHGHNHQHSNTSQVK
jgi:hypothetical protein